MLSAEIKDALTLNDGMRPYVLVSDIAPAKLLNYLTKHAPVVQSLGKNHHGKLITFLSFLHDQIAIADEKPFYIFSIYSISEALKISVTTLRRSIEQFETHGLLKRHSITNKNYSFNTWELAHPTIQQEADERLSKGGAVTPVPIREKHEKTDKQLLNWAENLDQQETRMLLYGRSIFQIFRDLFIKKTDRKNGHQSITTEIMLNDQPIPAVISCNVNSELPFSDDVIKYFAVLECVEQSMRENFNRFPSSVLKRITYEVPINKIIEQMDIRVGTASRTEVLKSLKRLESKIELSELPESEYLVGKESFISFQPLSNLSILKVKKLDQQKITGEGALIATFTLPEFIVNSLVQRVCSFKPEQLTNFEQAGLIEELLELPSSWLKGKYDLLAETLLTLKSNQSAFEKGKYFMTWAKLHLAIDSSKSPGTLKLAVWTQAEKKGATVSGSTNRKLTLSYKDIIAEFNDEGVSLFSTSF